VCQSHALIAAEPNLLASRTSNLSIQALRIRERYERPFPRRRGEELLGRLGRGGRVRVGEEGARKDGFEEPRELF